MEIERVFVILYRRCLGMMMKRNVFSWGIPLILIGTVGLCRWQSAWAEAYARHVYPYVSSVLSAFSSLFPFSVGDCFIVGACAWLIGYPFYAWWKKKGWRKTIGVMIRFLMWTYVWFYGAWGLNYFRDSFYERTGVAEVEYDAGKFQRFLTDYIDRLNESYVLAGDRGGDWYLEPWRTSDCLKAMPVETGIQERYRKIAASFGLVSSGKFLKAKPMLWSGGMSRLGVSGYMGPFFSEFNLNQEVLNVEYPFTYAHELAHRLGIAGEAEANLYAYLVTVSADEPAVRFSGCFSMLGYAMSNARRLLSGEEYRQLLARIRPEIVELYNQERQYWREKYSPGAGEVQNKVYNAYLKGNRISSGTKNYSEVVGLWMALEQSGYRID